MTKLSDATSLKVMVPEEYESKGEKRTRWYDIGTAFLSSSRTTGEEYISVRLAPGVLLAPGAEFQIRQTIHRDKEQQSPPPTTTQRGTMNTGAKK